MGKKMKMRGTDAERAFAGLAAEACDLARVAIAELARVRRDSNTEGLFLCVELAAFAVHLGRKFGVGGGRAARPTRMAREPRAPRRNGRARKAALIVQFRRRRTLKVAR